MRLNCVPISAFALHLPKVESLRRQIYTVSHSELLPLQASQGIQDFSVILLSLQVIKDMRHLLFLILFVPSAAGTEPALKQFSKIKDKI